MTMSDKDGSGEVDKEEFLELMRMMRQGDSHEGPIAPRVRPRLAFMLPSPRFSPPAGQATSVSAC